VREWFGVNHGWDAKEWGFDAVCQVFILLTGGTSFDVFGDPCPSAWPEIFLVYASDCFVSSRVAIEGTIVPSVHNFAFQALIGRDNKAVCGSVLPEWCAGVVHLFDGKCAFPLFYEGGVVILDDGDEMFYGAEGIFVCNMDEKWFGEHDHLLVVVFAYVGSWRSR
jgi:hypothetical protein